VSVTEQGGITGTGWHLGVQAYSTPISCVRIFVVFSCEVQLQLLLGLLLADLYPVDVAYMFSSDVHAGSCYVPYTCTFTSRKHAHLAEGCV
jgi:hypothetical protein